MQESLTLIHQQTHSAHNGARLAYTNKYTKGERERAQLTQRKWSDCRQSSRLGSPQTQLTSSSAACFNEWLDDDGDDDVDVDVAASSLLSTLAAQCPCFLIGLLRVRQLLFFLPPMHTHTQTEVLVLLLFSFRFSFGVLLLNEAEPLLLPLRRGFYCASS